MDRSFYLGMARSAVRLPVITHLVLHEQPDPGAVVVDGERLAAVIVAAARRHGSPLALPLMDLTLEKELLLSALGMASDQTATRHLTEVPDLASLNLNPLASPRMAATCEALHHLAQARAQGAPEVPVGMCIGPFSLLTKLMADPITPTYLAGSGVEPDDDEDVELLLGLLPLAEATVRAYAQAQIDAGAAALFVCEPAANVVYFSPTQLRTDDAIFEALVVEPNRRLADQLAAAGVDLILHDCGELIPEMVAALASLRPVMLSLGSSVPLWDAVPHVAPDVVLYGNLPTKQFYSDAEVPLAAVPQMVAEIDERMRTTGHPYIVGSECDILAMPGYEATIAAKVAALVRS